MMLDESDIRTHDKRQAAIHEAGHLTVALASGVSGRAWIFPTETEDLLEAKTWTGKFATVGCPNSPEICIAGVVAECWVEDSQVEASEIVEFIEDEFVIPSPTDMKGIPVVSEKLVSTALELLRAYKTFFDWAVAELINDEVITDGMASEYFRSVDEREGG